MKVLTNGASCPAGTVATGGGVDLPNFKDARILSSKPSFDPTTYAPTGWVATVEYTVTQSPAAIQSPPVYVVCAG